MFFLLWVLSSSVVNHNSWTTNNISILEKLEQALVQTLFYGLMMNCLPTQATSSMKIRNCSISFSINASKRMSTLFWRILQNLLGHTSTQSSLRNLSKFVIPSNLYPMWQGSMKTVARKLSGMLVLDLSRNSWTPKKIYPISIKLSIWYFAETKRQPLTSSIELVFLNQKCRPSLTTLLNSPTSSPSIQCQSQ